MNFLKQILKYKYFLYNTVKYELKLRYKNTKLGSLWVFISPLLYFFVLGFVFSFMNRGNLENFKLFFISGMVPWMMLNNAIMTLIPSLENNAGLLQKIAIPKYIFPISGNIARFVDNIVFITILIILYAFSGGPFHLFQLWFIPLMILIFITSLGIGFFLAILNVFFRDTVHLMNIIFQILFFVTPIIYPFKVIPPDYRFIFLLNPFYYYIEVFHNIFYYQIPPKASHLLIIFAVSFFSLILSAILYKNTEKKIVFYLSY